MYNAMLNVRISGMVALQGAKLLICLYLGVTEKNLINILANALSHKVNSSLRDFLCGVN